MRREYWVILLLLLSAVACNLKGWHVLEFALYAASGLYAYVKRV